MNISIFGLGYVGTVTAASLASKGHSVIGVDINADKVAMINASVSPIVEPGLVELIGQTIATGSLKATTDPEEALSRSDLCFLAVATPSKSNGQIDSAHLLRACEQIAGTLTRLHRRQIVVIRSSILPATFVENEKIFQELSPGLAHVCVNPEFLREGTAIDDFFNPPFTVIGTSNIEGEHALRELYGFLDAPLHVLRPEEATMIKYASNVYHGLKVAFGNEMGMVCKAKGIDSTRVMSVFCQDTKLNISKKYLMPGFAFGGSCLPKDIRAILYTARESDIELPLVHSILLSNKYLVEKTLQKILSYGRKRVGLVGLSFKSDTDDLRESPLVELGERLVGKGIDLSIYDPNVSLARLTGANRSYIDAVIPHVSQLLVHSLEELTKQSDVIVIGHEFKGVSGLPQHMDPATIILDFCNVAELRTVCERYDGIAW